MQETKRGPGFADRPTVYFLHGLLGTAYGHFGRQITAWSDWARPIPVDLPGHGRCALDAGADYLDVALEYVLALLDRFGPGRIVAASHLGGPLAVRCALRRPDRVTSLVLTGFAPGMDRTVFTTLLAGFHRLTEDDSELAAEYDRLHTGRWRKTLAAFTEHVEQRYESTALIHPETFQDIAAPTLIINGDLKSVERAAARNAGTFGPRVRGVVLTDAGHIASHDAPESFNAEVLSFWTTGGVR